MQLWVRMRCTKLMLPSYLHTYLLGTEPKRREVAKAESVFIIPYYSSLRGRAVNNVLPQLKQEK
jgi:hypothetical protein